MEDFYDKIKDKMSNAPEVPTDWEMWDGIESTLDKKKRNRFLPVLLGLPFLLLLSGVIGYWMAPKPDSINSDNLEVARDTIYLTESIHTIDTVLQTEYITKWKYRSSDDRLAFQSQIQNLSTINSSLTQSLEGLNRKLNDYRYAFTNSILKNDPKYKDLDFFNSDSQTISPSNDIALNLDRSTIDALHYSPLLTTNLIDYDRPKLILTHNLLFENLVKNKKSQSLLEQLIPDYINVGASIEAPGLVFTKNLKPGTEIGLGLNVELMFSPRFSLVTGVRTRSTQNKTTDQTIAELYPQPIESPDDVFKNLAVKTSFIDVPITFKYDILKLRQNNVYLTGGLLVSQHRQTEYLYEYIRNSSEVYYEEKGVNLGWALGSSILGIGYEFDPWTNTSAFVESTARYNFNSKSEAIHGIGFRFGMYYKI